MVVIYTTKKGVEIGVLKGKKSLNNFKVVYKEPGKRLRTPKHIHIIIDLYIKLTADRKLTLQLVEYVINNIIMKVQPATSFPPSLQVFHPSHINQFAKLDNYGEYPVEFLLPIIELIQIQERTNYPKGTMNLNLFKLFQQGADIFSVVSAATFR